MNICQMRDVAGAWLDALPLNIKDQKLRLSKAAQEIRKTQRKNAAARASHAQARRAELKAIGIRVETLRCCIPP